MVLMFQFIFDVVEKLIRIVEKFWVVLFCLQGECYIQVKVEELVVEEYLIFICGYYEGYDE